MFSYPFAPPSPFQQQRHLFLQSPSLCLHFTFLLTMPDFSPLPTYRAISLNRFLDKTMPELLQQWPYNQKVSLAMIHIALPRHEEYKFECNSTVKN